MASISSDLVVALFARDNSSLPAGDTPQQYAQDGRYDYKPSAAAAYAFIAIYANILIVNLIQYIFYRAWFWWPMLLTIAMEFSGYLTRAISVHNLFNKGVFITQTILLLVAPLVLAASCYMAFGRVILWVVPPERRGVKTLWLPARLITPIFVTSDVATFLIQGAGGAMVASASTQTTANRGKDVVLIGLAIQVLTFSFFILTALRLSFLLRSIQHKKTVTSKALPTDTNWPLFLTAIIIGALLILIRSIYRFVEYAIGTRNYVSDHEAFFYGLDSVPIFLVVLLFTFLHPGQYLPFIGIRRKNGEKWSKNRDRGLCKKLARGKDEPQEKPIPNAV